MGKFEEQFDEPIKFSEGSYVLDGQIPKKEAAKIFSLYFDEVITSESLSSDRVRFRFGVIDYELVPAWFDGAGNSKGTKPVWVYG